METSTAGPTTDSTTGMDTTTTTSTGPTTETMTETQGETDVTTDSVDPCPVPELVFLGLGQDGIELFDLPGFPPTGEMESRWSFEAPQFGIEVSKAGALFAIEHTAEAWVIREHCYEDGSILSETTLDIPLDREVVSFTSRPSGLIVVAETGLVDGEFDFYRVSDGGETIADLPGSIGCFIDDEPDYFPVIEWVASDDVAFAMANELDQLVYPGDNSCVNYTGDYAMSADGVEWYTWMDFDPSSYDAFFETTYDLYGLSPYGNLYLRGLFDAASPELVAEFPENLRAFAIGPP